MTSLAADSSPFLHWYPQKKHGSHPNSWTQNTNILMAEFFLKWWYTWVSSACRMWSNKSSYLLHRPCVSMYVSIVTTWEHYLHVLPLKGPVAVLYNALKLFCFSSSTSAFQIQLHAWYLRILIPRKSVVCLTSDGSYSVVGKLLLISLTLGVQHYK